MKIFQTLGFKAGLVSVMLLLLFIGAWYLATAAPAGTGPASTAGMTAEQIEY